MADQATITALTFCVPVALQVRLMQYFLLSQPAHHSAKRQEQPGQMPGSPRITCTDQQ
jgi:hypothetical protein